MADYLRRKYDGTEINAIIAIYAQAVDFLLANRRTLFPGVPIIAAEVFRGYAENLEHLPACRFVTGTIMGDNVTGMLDAALRMRPATKRLALVNRAEDALPRDVYFIFSCICLTALTAPFTLLKSYHVSSSTGSLRSLPYTRHPSW